MLIGNVRLTLAHCLKQVKSGKVLRQGSNGACLLGIPAYFTAVACVEAFLNEHFLDPFSYKTRKNNPLWLFPEEDLDQLKLEKKLLIVPQFLFGKSFIAGSQPYQDMILLIQVRNYLVHYRTHKSPPKGFKDLEQRNIILSDREYDNAVLPLPFKLSCNEGIRWAHNTACLTIKELLTFAAEDKHFQFMAQFYEKYSAFEPITEQQIQDWLESYD